MLESMMMGAFPIQSDTVSTGEWIQNGVNGILVDPDDAEGLASAITRAIGDSELLESAAGINRQLIGEKLERDVVRQKVVDIYKRILDGKL